MRNRNSYITPILLCVFVVLVICAGTVMALPDKFWASIEQNQNFKQDVAVQGTTYLKNDEAVTNTTDGKVELTFDDDAAKLGELSIYSSNTSTADNDYLRMGWSIEDSASGKTEMARLDVVADDQTTATEDSTMNFAVITAGTLANELSLVGSALYPATSNGLDLGKTDKLFNAAYFTTANITNYVMANGETIANAVDAHITTTYDDDAVELGEWSTVSSNSATEDNNYFRKNWIFKDSGDVAQEAARVDIVIDDVTGGTEDATVNIGVVTNGTVANELSIDGAKAYPSSNGGLDLGSSANRFGTLYVANVDYSSTLVQNSAEVWTAASVSLTSPTVTFSAANKRYITLNSDANQTGFVVTGGTLGQVIYIVSGTGSNTMRFDDATDVMAVGSNVTLTEGQSDVLALICTDAGGAKWAALYAHDN